MIPISMKTDIWLGSLVRFGTDPLRLHKAVGWGKQFIWENITMTRWTLWKPGQGNPGTAERAWRSYRRERKWENQILSSFVLLVFVVLGQLDSARKEKASISSTTGLKGRAYPSGPISNCRIWGMPPLNFPAPWVFPPDISRDQHEDCSQYMSLLSGPIMLLQAPSSRYLGIISLHPSEFSGKQGQIL